MNYEVTMWYVTRNSEVVYIVKNTKTYKYLKPGFTTDKEARKYIRKLIQVSCTLENLLKN